MRMSCSLFSVGRALTFMVPQLREEPGTSTRADGAVIADSEGILSTHRPVP